jgi:nitronate monooxygenase
VTLRTRLTELLGTRYPILSAPISSLAGGAFASAVSAAGGFGSIGGGLADQPLEWLDREFAAAGGQRVGCGFITWAMAKPPEVLDRALGHSPPAIMLSFGDPAPFIPPIKERGALVICQVHSLAQARAVLAAGADIIVAQGTEAGGHGGTRRATMTLVPAVADMVRASGRDAPVVAAGGIADGRGLAAALMLGADGVLMGSRFYVSEECLAPAAAKARVVASEGDDTLRTSVFDLARRWEFPPGINGRVLRNRFTDAWHGREAELLAASEREFARYYEAAAAGDYDVAHIHTGEVIDLIHAVEPAGAIVERVVREAEEALSRRLL